jgi:(1->4)-alpha-D-glucan 1-alpha-D-glucosylmutase
MMAQTDSHLAMSARDVAVLSQTLGARLPLATYRLQFTPSFTFADAAQLVPYLSALGVSDCYVSPCFQACPGSAHGYDVIDHNALNPELGGEAAYETFIQALQRHGMGQLLDIVPNHMGIAKSLNPWWTDVLENGPSSLYAACFDIDWMPIKLELANKVLLPILGDQYGHVLENQEFRLCYEDGAFLLLYYDHRLPIAPRPAVAILLHRLGDLERQLGAEQPDLLEFRSIITALGHLPLRSETDRDKIIERSREKEIIKKRLAALTHANPTIRTFVEDNVRFFNGVKGEPRSFDFLDALLTDQAYRLAYWRVAAEEINYRRFFDINELAAIRTEDPLVFSSTHQLALRLLAEGKVTGLRIDHVDGLYDPLRYLRRLQHAAALALQRGVYPETPSTWSRADQQVVQRQIDTALLPGESPCYVVVEKILSEGEAIPEHWPIHGSTGYDFLATLNGLFVDQAQEKALTDVYARFTRTHPDFSNLVYESKKLIMQVSLSSEINVLSHHLNRLSERDRHARDFTLNSLTHAIREVIACFPVYRTYADGEGVTTERDRGIIETAVRRATRKNPATDSTVFNYLRDILLLRYPDSASEADREAQRAFVLKFQQCTSPVMAKGVEDTAFYRYHRLVSLNEVGGAPGQFGVSLSVFHQQNQDRQQRWPSSLLATSTHDTKRSEDVRARINVLSELPREWRTLVGRWSRQHRKRKTIVDGHPAPDRNDEYLLYQTVLGVWPFSPMTVDEYAVFKRRIQDYMQKAAKEAKVRTSWINPHQAYDEALLAFVSRVLDDFLVREDFQRFRTKIAQYGLYNALSQTLLKLTAPGVPDLYQGSELWDFSLVDPDNRRPVDYDRRRWALQALQEQSATAGADLRALARELLEQREDGRVKLYVTHRTLRCRRERADLFLRGEYLPLSATGDRGQRICAFARRQGNSAVLVVAPRLLAQVIPDATTLPIGSEVWADTQLPLPSDLEHRCYRNVFTGAAITAKAADGGSCLALGEVLADFPVALLVTAPATAG